MSDNVNHPEHYNKCGIEVFDVMAAFGLTDFLLGNACKYLLRCKHKGNECEDLKKCVFYITKYLEIAESAGAPEPTDYDIPIGD